LDEEEDCRVLHDPFRFFLWDGRITTGVLGWVLFLLLLSSSRLSRLEFWFDWIEAWVGSGEESILFFSPFGKGNSSS
jgi:hypothetical protein